MTQEDKELLLKDLCGRLPYGVKCYAYQFKIDGNHCECNGTLDYIHGNYFYLKDRVSVNNGKTYEDRYLDIKPYLRPMTSMTEEERKELDRLGLCEDNAFHEDIYGNGVFYDDATEVFDYLNSHYFDYRGLIEKGLAIEVTEENNPYKD